MLLFVQKAILGPENLDFLKMYPVFVYIFGHKTPLASLIFTKKGSVSSWQKTKSKTHRLKK